jgi:hypothetical protein
MKKPFFEALEMFALTILTGEATFSASSLGQDWKMLLIIFCLAGIVGFCIWVGLSKKIDEKEGV